MFELSDMDRKTRELHWELYLMERMGMKKTARYIKKLEEFYQLVSKVRKIRGLSPYEPDK